MNRRQILTGLCAVGAVAFLPDMSPVLYGDGVHDDSIALKLWCEGSPIKWSTGELVGDVITNKCFWVPKGVYITHGAGRTIQYCVLNGNKCRPDPIEMKASLEERRQALLTHTARKRRIWI